MRTIILLAIASLCAAADTTATLDTRSGPPSPPKFDTAPGPTAHALTADDLQNLVVCARRSLPTLTADELSAVAVSIKHAEDTIVAMRTPPAPPAEKPATPKP